MINYQKQNKKTQPNNSNPTKTKKQNQTITNKPNQTKTTDFGSRKTNSHGTFWRAIQTHPNLFLHQLDLRRRAERNKKD